MASATRVSMPGRTPTAGDSTGLGGTLATSPCHLALNSSSSPPTPPCPAWGHVKDVTLCSHKCNTRKPWAGWGKGCHSWHEGGGGTRPSVLTCFCKVSMYKWHFLKEEKKERGKKNKTKNTNQNQTTKHL